MNEWTKKKRLEKEIRDTIKAGALVIKKKCPMKFKCPAIPYWDKLYALIVKYEKNYGDANGQF